MALDQYDEQWLQTATPSQITQALDAGHLAELMGQRIPQPAESQVDDDQLTSMSPAEIATAFEAGHLDQLLGREKSA